MKEMLWSLCVKGGAGEVARGGYRDAVSIRV